MFGQLITLWQSKVPEIDNSYIVNATIKYLLDSGRFNGPLLLFTKQFDFDYTYGWLVLDFFGLFVTLMLMISY